MTACLFFNIVSGKIPCSKIYEDDEFFAFLDLYPINRGHTLVIPKTHCKNLLDFPKIQETDLMEVLKKVADAVMRATKADGFNLGMNNGKASGQVIHHAHFHIIPRFEKDGLSSWPNKEYRKGEIDKTRDEIVKFL